MSSRHAQGADHFDLLPFIAILMSTLGCLLLVTLAMSALSLGNSREEWSAEMSGSERQTKVPILVEWDGRTAVVHRSGRTTEIPMQLVTHSGRQYPDPDSLAPEFEQFLRWMEQHKDRNYALVAVRPSGFTSRRDFSQLFRKRDIDVGSEPIGQSRSVSLEGQNPL